MPNSAINESQMHIPSKTHFQKAVGGGKKFFCGQSSRMKVTLKLNFVLNSSAYKQKFLQQFQNTGKQAFSALTIEFWHCFVFWKQFVYLAIKNQIFNRHSLPLSVRKMSHGIV